MENATNPLVAPVSQIQTKIKQPAEKKPDMCKLWYLRCEFRDMEPTVCWPNSKQIFQEMVSAPRCLEQTRCEGWQQLNSLIATLFSVS